MTRLVAKFACIHGFCETIMIDASSSKHAKGNCMPYTSNILLCTTPKTGLLKRDHLYNNCEILI